jgi:heme-degrading monooxygenase HmoA
MEEQGPDSADHGRSAQGHARALGSALRVCETVGSMELDGNYVWLTRRRLKPGSREEFSRSWRPREFPEGMLRAYELVSADGNEVVGVSIWDSGESRDRYRLSEVESERRRAMAPYVLEEVSGFYLARELRIPRG